MLKFKSKSNICKCNQQKKRAEGNQLYTRLITQVVSWWVGCLQQQWKKTEDVLRKEKNRKQKWKSKCSPQKGVTLSFDSIHTSCVIVSAWVWTGKLWKTGQPRTFHMARGQQGVSESLILKTEGEKRKAGWARGAAVSADGSENGPLTWSYSRAPG